METNDRIKDRMRTLGLKGVDITREIGVSSGAISQWRAGDNKPAGENLLNLARMLQCTPDWLLTGQGPAPTEAFKVKESGSAYFNTEPGPIVANRVPLLSLVQAGAWTEVEERFMQDAMEWRETTARVSAEAFALRVVGDSMLNPHGSPSIPEGSVVIVDPEIEPTNGRIVVARLSGTQEATLKKLVIDGSQRYLMPLNPSFKPIDINGNCKIIGVVRKIEIDI